MVSFASACFLQPVMELTAVTTDRITETPLDTRALPPPKAKSLLDALLVGSLVMDSIGVTVDVWLIGLGLRCILL